MIVTSGCLEEVQRVHFLDVERILEARRDVGDLGDVDREQEDVGHIDLPGPLQDARAGDDEAALHHGAAIDESRRVAGNEDEDFGRVAEAVVADGEPGDDVVRHVIEKDQPEREPAKQIEPQIASGRHGCTGTAGAWIIGSLDDRKPWSQRAYGNLPMH